MTESIYYNLARMTSLSTGDSDIVLAAAVVGCKTFADAGVSDSEDVEYGLITYSTSTRQPVGSETGTGRYISSGLVFKRTTVESSTDSDNSAIELTGNTQIYLNPLASWYNNILTKAPVLWQDQATVILGNGFARNLDSNQPYGYVVQQTASADSDEWNNGFVSRFGTYTMKLLVLTANSCGLLDIYIDDVLVSSGLDFYTVGTVEAATLQVSDVVITTNGYHTLKGKVNGKNVLSSGYDIPITKIWFVPVSY